MIVTPTVNPDGSMHRRVRVPDGRKGYVVDTYRREYVGAPLYSHVLIDNGAHLKVDDAALEELPDILNWVGYSAFDFDRDMSGNPTAHYVLYHDYARVKATKRRQQIGYNGVTHTAADVAMREYIRKNIATEFLIFADTTSPGCGFSREFTLDASVSPWPTLDRSASNARDFVVIDAKDAQAFETHWRATFMIAGNISLLMGQVEHLVRSEIVTKSFGAHAGKQPNVHEILTGVFDEAVSAVLARLRGVS